MNGDDAASGAVEPPDPEGDPVLLLAAWVLSTGYGVSSGEMTLRPATIVGAILNLGSVISTIWVGWPLRRVRAPARSAGPTRSPHRTR